MAFQIFIIVAAVVIGWVRHGNIWNLGNIRLKTWWILPIAYVLQHISVAYFSGPIYETMIILSYAIMIVFCVINFRIAGVSWALSGTVANFVALLANGLRMPAYIPAVKAMAPQLVSQLEAGTYGKSIAMTTSTHLNFLGDIFAFNVRPASLLSIGDILFSIGLVILIQQAMRATDKGRVIHA